MTVVGSVSVEVLALVDQNRVSKQIADGLSKPSMAAGAAAGKTMGRHIGDSAAAELEKSGARFARSGRLLSNVFTQNSAQALGPLQEVADRVSLIGATLDQTKTKAGGLLLGVGSAFTGIGAFLATLHSREQGATNQLAASIAATGGSIDDYRDRIDAAVKSGEKFGQSGNQTIDALQALTIGLHDPKKALDELGLAEDVAAAKHISLGSAANLVRQAYNGNTRVLKAFGIQVADVVDGQKLLAVAQGAAVGASSAATKAQHEYTDKLLIYRDTLKPTLAQAVALTNAHDKLTAATAAQARAQAQLADAQQKANDAGSKGQEVLDRIREIVAGQKEAAANTFVGHLKAIGAALEDDAAKVGGKAGTALIEFGPALAAGGFLIESGLIPTIARGVAGYLALGGQSTATAVEIEVASTAEVASLDTVVTAIGELQLALTGIGPSMAASTSEVVAQSVTQTAAIDAEAASAGRLQTILRGIAGLGGATLGIVGAGITVAVKEAMDTNRLTGSLDAQVKQLRNLELTATTNDDLQAAINAAIAKAKKLGAEFDDQGNVVVIGSDAKHANQRTRGAEILDDVLKARKFLAGAGAGGSDSGADDAKAAARARTVSQMIQHAAGKPKASAAANTIAEINQQLAALGLPPIASSALDKGLADAQKAAADRARALGKTVTDGLNSQLDAVKQHAAAVNDQLKTIISFRNQVVSSASSFTSLPGLLPDNSLATSGSIVAQLHQRNAAEVLFGKNIQNLAGRHLDPEVIAQIEGEGPDRGRALAAALAQGSDSDIRQLNLETEAARRQAQVLGSQAVTARFGAGTQAKANAELVKLNAQISGIQKTLDAQPALIAKAVDQAQKNAKVTTRAVARRGGSV